MKNVNNYKVGYIWIFSHNIQYDLFISQIALTALWDTNFSGV